MCYNITGGDRKMNKDFFPNNLKYLLDSEQITAKTILQITGNNSPGLITMWKNGERQITTKDLVKIANHLGYTVDDLINKDLTKQNDNCFNKTQVLFDKSKDILSDDDRATIEFIMRKTIDNYEKNKNNIDK